MGLGCYFKAGNDKAGILLFYAKLSIYIIIQYLAETSILNSLHLVFPSKCLQRFYLCH